MLSKLASPERIISGQVELLREIDRDFGLFFGKTLISLVCKDIRSSLFKLSVCVYAQAGRSVKLLCVCFV